MDIRESKALVGIVEFLELVERVAIQGLKDCQVTLASTDYQGIVESREFQVIVGRAASLVIPGPKVSRAIQEIAVRADTQVFRVILELRGYLDTLALQEHLGILVKKAFQVTPGFQESLDIRALKVSQGILELKVSLDILDLKE